MYIWGKGRAVGQVTAGRVRLFVDNHGSGRVGSTFRRVGSMFRRVGSGRAGPGPRKVTRGYLGSDTITRVHESVFLACGKILSKRRKLNFLFPALQTLNQLQFLSIWTGSSDLNVHREQAKTLLYQFGRLIVSPTSPWVGTRVIVSSIINHVTWSLPDLTRPDRTRPDLIRPDPPRLAFHILVFPTYFVSEPTWAEVSWPDLSCSCWIMWKIAWYYDSCSVDLIIFYPRAVYCEGPPSFIIVTFVSESDISKRLQITKTKFILSRRWRLQNISTKQLAHAKIFRSFA